MFGIYQSTVELLISIFKKYEKIEKVVIYGSRAKGNYREGSDIDLTIFGEIDKSDLYKILDEIDESSPPYLFDISIFKELKSDNLIDHINRIGKVFYEKT